VRKTGHMWSTLDGAMGAKDRDDQGHFVAAASWVLPNVSNVDSAELIANKHDINLAARISCSPVQIESVAVPFPKSFVVENIQNQEACHGLEAGTITECNILKLDLTKVSFSHCCREANTVADALASYPYTNISSDFWESSIPDFIFQLFVNDMSII
jgi:hypothetical protein